MRRRLRPALWGLLAAVSTTAAGLSINIATENQGSLAAWIAVAACTALTGTATLRLNRPPDSRVPLEILTIETTYGPDGVTVRVHAEGTRALDIAGGWAPPLPPAPPAPPVFGGETPEVLPKPLPVALVTRARTTGIARRLTDLHAAQNASDDLELRLCVDDAVEPRLAALRGAPVVVLDDRCSMDGTGLRVGGIDLGSLDGLEALAVVLSCDDGAGAEHVRALRRGLRRPAAVLACNGTVPGEHLAVLYPMLLRSMGALAGSRTTAGDVRTAMRDTLVRAGQERPGMQWHRWTAELLHPLNNPAGRPSQGLPDPATGHP